MNVLEIEFIGGNVCRAQLKMEGKAMNPKGEFLSPYLAIQWASELVGCSNFITCYIGEELED